MRTKSSKSGVYSQNPMDVFQIWLDGAKAAKVQDPTIISLATANGKGQASNRIIRIIDIRAQGFVFVTHECSMKGKQIAETNWSAGVMYWPTIGQQVIVSGPTYILEDEESDFFWNARPIQAHPMSAVSLQSNPLENEDVLRQEAAELEKLNKPLPRPSQFKAYIIKPHSMEFWKSDPARLHLRLHYLWDGEKWGVEQLQP